MLNKKINKKPDVLLTSKQGCVYFFTEKLSLKMAPDLKYPSKKSRDHWTEETSEGRWQTHQKGTPQEKE